jgi:hypothetical protein
MESGIKDVVSGSWPGCSAKIVGVASTIADAQVLFAHMPMAPKRNKFNPMTARVSKFSLSSFQEHGCQPIA